MAALQFYYTNLICYITTICTFQKWKLRMRILTITLVLIHPSIQEIYEEVRNHSTEDMDSKTKLLFLQDFPTFIEIKTILARKRREVIPADPKVMTNIDLDLPVFFYKDEENVVKGDLVLRDGRLTTKEHLRILVGVCLPCRGDSF